MKKNRTMRIAAVMLVFALLTTCIISGSFAKYVTTGSTAGETARVAKWGVTIEGTGTTFAKNYLKNVGATANTGTTETTGITVKSSTNDLVVAPGTKGTLASFTVTGTPEVSAQINYEATITFENGWNASTCPIVFTVNGEEKTAAQVADAIAGASATFDVSGTSSFADTMNAGLTVGWEWPFAGNDVSDTAFGDAAARGEAPTVTISITATITQVD